MQRIDYPRSLTATLSRKYGADLSPNVRRTWSVPLSPKVAGFPRVFVWTECGQSSRGEYVSRQEAAQQMRDARS